MQKRWVGESNRCWEDPKAWDPPGVPRLVDDVVLPSGTQLVVAGSVKVNTIKTEAA